MIDIGNKQNIQAAQMCDNLSLFCFSSQTINIINSKDKAFEKNRLFLFFFRQSLL